MVCLEVQLQIPGSTSKVFEAYDLLSEVEVNDSQRVCTKFHWDRFQVHRTRIGVRSEMMSNAPKRRRKKAIPEMMVCFKSGVTAFFKPPTNILAKKPGGRSASCLIRYLTLRRILKTLRASDNCQQPQAFNSSLWT